jgi:hypothetical protein
LSDYTRIGIDKFNSLSPFPVLYSVRILSAVPELFYLDRRTHRNAGQNHDIKIGNRCFENVAQFTYLETAVTNQNPIQEEIKRRLNSGNAC